MQNNSESAIISSAYWGPIQYYTKFLKYQKLQLEVCETYPRQTFRNRMQIYGPNGIQSLQVPVLKGSFHKTIIKDLKISYETNWQKNHLKTIEAAYKSSPYYDYYIDDIIPIYKNKFDYLIDLNNEINQLVLENLQIDIQITNTLEYQPTYKCDDYRIAIHPKPNRAISDTQFVAKEYIQGFEARHGFIPNLSILDLIFNTGPEASTILSQSCK